MDFSEQIYEALENLDQEKVRSLVESDENEGGILTVEMISRALDMGQEDIATLVLMALYRHYDLTDESAQRLSQQATQRGLHSFLKVLLMLDSGHYAVAEDVVRELNLGRMRTADSAGKVPQLHACVANSDQWSRSMAYFYTLMGVPVNAQNKDGDSALHLAVRKGDAELVEALLQCGVSPMLRNKHGRTAAETAARAGNTHLAELVGAYEPGLTWGLEHGDAGAVAHALRRWVAPHAVIDAASGRTALALCRDARLPACTAPPGLLNSVTLAHHALADHMRGLRADLAVSQALTLNLNIRHCASGMTPLAAAVRNHDGQMMTELLSRGARVNIRVNNVPLIIMAMRWGTPFPLVKDLLMKEESDGNSQIWRERDPEGLTLFLHAIKYQRPAAEIEQLLHMSPGRQCIAQRASEGRLNALELAAETGRPEVVEAIDRAVAALFVRARRCGEARAALMRLAIADYGAANFRHAAEELAEDETVARFVGGLAALEEDRAALFRAVAEGDYAAVKALNQADYVDQDGRSALTRAVVCRQLEVAEWLVAERPQLKFMGDNDNCYPLHYAYALPEPIGDKFVALLLARDGDALQELCDKDGDIPCCRRRRADDVERRAALETAPQ